MRWRNAQKLDTVYPYNLWPKTAFGSDGSALSYWSAPTAVTRSPQGSGFLELDSDFQMASARYNSSTGWSQITSYDTPNPTRRPLCVDLTRINARGEALAAYVSLSSDSSQAMLMVQRFTASGWSDPVMLASHAYDGDPVCAIGIDDQGNGLTAINFGKGVLTAYFTPTGGWGAATAPPGLTNPGTQAPSIGQSEIWVAMQPSAEAVLVLQDYSSNPPTLIAGTFSAAAGWRSDWSSPPHAGSGPQGEARLAASERGDIIAVSNQYADQTQQHASLIAYRYSRTQGWNAGEMVADLGDSGAQASNCVAINSDGNAWVVFGKTTLSPMSSVWARPYSPATGWGTAIQISDESTGLQIDPAGIAMTDGGAAVAAWRIGGYRSDGVHVNRFDIQAGWVGPTQVTMPPDVFITSVQVGFGANTTPTVIWSANMGGDDNSYGYASLYLSKWE